MTGLDRQRQGQWTKTFHSKERVLEQVKNLLEQFGTCHREAFEHFRGLNYTDEQAMDLACDFVDLCMTRDLFKYRSVGPVPTGPIKMSISENGGKTFTDLGEVISLKKEEMSDASE